MINIGNTYEKSMGTPWNTYKNVVENYGKISGTFAWETPGTTVIFGDGSKPMSYHLVI
jgi:hypothetical protein